MKNINVLCTRKQFLIGSGAAAIGLFCSRNLLQAQPGISPSASAPLTTPESANNVPDFPEHLPKFDRSRVKRFVIGGHVNLLAVRAMLCISQHCARTRASWNPFDCACRKRRAGGQRCFGISAAACRSTHLLAMNTKLLIPLILVSLSFAAAIAANDTREQAASIIAQIQRADYEGDRVAMQRGYDELKPFMEDQKLVSRIRYWRGFAQWRLAINGFNDSVDPRELEQNLKTALDEFKRATEKDPKFVDAKIGTISCLGFLAFMNRKDQVRAKELVAQILPLVGEAEEMARDNPRLIWVHGPILWNSPPERGGGQEKAIQNYQRGLEVCSKIKPNDDPLEPSWGKPELMMSLAYCYLNANSADVNTAERYARNALEIVPYWHYVRDILLPQIVAAKAKLQ